MDHNAKLTMHNYTLPDFKTIINLHASFGHGYGAHHLGQIVLGKLQVKIDWPFNCGV